MYRYPKDPSGNCLVLVLLREFQLLNLLIDYREIKEGFFKHLKIIFPRIPVKRELSFIPLMIVWLSGGKPASVSEKGEVSAYSFSTRQQVEREARYRAAFDLAWRFMRDCYYDGRLGNRNWDAIRRRYVDMAAKAVDASSFGIVVNLMLGELNGSHLGFYSRGQSSGEKSDWNIATAHLGVRFEADYKGPGLKIRDVLPDPQVPNTPMVSGVAVFGDDIILINVRI